ncbi:hypothetical protein D3C71_481030 [compost metagenome]
MNPFASNPFELIDKAGLWTAARVVKWVYATFRFSPIAMHHAPRALIILFGAAVGIADPGGHPLTLFGTALFALVCGPKLLADLPNIRSEWDANLYRKYQAVALSMRGDFMLRSFVQMILLVLMASNISGFSSRPVFTAVANLCLLACLAVGWWFDACDLPEPDDGDAFARPHAA